MTIVFLGLLGLGVKSAYKLVREQRTIGRARTLLDQKKYGEAALAVQWALQLDPNDMRANQMMAEVMENQGSKMAVVFRQKVAGLEPGVLDHYLAWANAAVRFGDIAAAQQALSNVDAAGKQTGAYQAITARLALSLNDRSLVKARIDEAVKLSPLDETLQLQQAAVQLGSTNPEEREAARPLIVKFASKPAHQRAALRVLLQEALFKRDKAGVWEWGTKLNLAEQATFEDRMVFLSILRKSGRREFWWALAQRQAEAVNNAQDASTLMRWLNRTGFAQIALDFGKTLPSEMQKQHPVPIAIAESCSLLGDWPGVKVQVRFGNWDDLEFQRFALLARALRDGDATESRKVWNAAVVAAGDQHDALTVLARLSQSWGWSEENIDVLWRIARGNVKQQVALDQLNRIYSAAGKTRELLNVVLRSLEVNPNDNTAKNNVAYLSFLLNTDLERAHALAREAYKTDPLNSDCASTYALSLYIQGKIDQGLQVMRALPERMLEQPGNALLFGMLLSDAQMRDQALKYLNLAESGRLFPQEQSLIAKARERLPRP